MTIMKFLAVFCTLVFIVAAFWGLVPTKEDQTIYDSTIRLHVLANSDSDHDQGVKLCVRDAVLRKMNEILSEASTTKDAAEALTAALPAIRTLCRETLQELGEEDAVAVILTEEAYPTRTYEAMRLPAGTYRSLQVRLGRAEGKNWWCVLFPTLCRNAARAEESLIKTGFTPEQIKILTDGESPKYKIKFKLLEVFSGAFSR